MNSQERRNARYERRKKKRQEKLQEINAEVGDIKTVMSFHHLYAEGLRCTHGVKWKHSAQRFRLRLFSGTAHRRSLIISGKYVYKPYTHFTINERGKVRPIDAPHIEDRQVQKVITNHILWVIYKRSMIYNNGASIKGKGLSFSQDILIQDLSKHFRKYGRNGHIILLDCKGFFPNADHDVIRARHDRLILRQDIKALTNGVLDTVKGGKGMPLGVEPSQAEMIALPSAVDNYMKCQLGIKSYGHYMDDFAILVPPDINPYELLNTFLDKLKAVGITPNLRKTHIVPLAKPFVYCKITYRLRESGKITMRGSKDGVVRGRRKLKKYKPMLNKGYLSYTDLYQAVQSVISYYDRYNDHSRSLYLHRLFYAIYGFPCERYSDFLEKEKNAMYRYTLTETNKVIGYSEQVNYIKRANNGCLIGCPASQASGVSFNGNPYKIAGIDGLDAPEVVVELCDYKTELYDAKNDIDDNATDIGDLNDALIELAGLVG